MLESGGMDRMENRPETEEFTKNQLDEIQKGIDAGIDVTLYAKKDFLAIQMQQIRLGLQAGVQAERYAKAEYDWFQMEELRKGLEEGIDISSFESPDISHDKMQQIRLGLSEGIDLSAYKRLASGVLKQMRLATKNDINIVPYIIVGYDAEQLEAIREALEKGIDVKPWVQKEYRGIALQEIFAGLENGLDVSAYAKIEYNWQQMREIRLGMEHMVDIEQYNKPFYSFRQMQEIRIGLENGLDVSYYHSPMYTASEMHNRRMALEENKVILYKEPTEKPEMLQSDWKEEEDTVKKFIIMLSKDEMEAYIEVADTTEKLERIEIVKALYQRGICYGIEYDMIDYVVSGHGRKKTLLIASGKQPVDGKDGWYEYFFRTELSGVPRQLENGELDYRDAEWFETVDEGQKLAVYHSAEKGKNGITITGKVIPAKHGKTKNFLVGKGFKRLADGRTYVSLRHGIVTLQENRLDVSRLLVVQEVNTTTGDVEYDGNILIEGNVGSGSKITASRDVIVRGFVEGAHIVCGGSVFLQKGMNGSSGGSIQAEGDVVGYFFEVADVHAGGNIQGDYFFKSSLHTQGIVKCVGKKGVIAGGNIFAEKGIKTMDIGNAVGLPTYVRLGNIENIRNKEKALEDSIKNVTQELVTLQNAHAEFKKKYPPEIRNSMEIYLKIESAIYTKEKQLERLLCEKSGIIEEIKQSGAAEAVVEGQIHEGVTVEIDGVLWQSRNTHNVTLQKAGSRISVFSNE